MEDKRQFTGWFIPVELRTVHNLDWIECVLWAEIYALSRRRKGCTASNEHLASRIGVSADRTCRIVSKLKGLGLVKQIGFDGRVRSLVATHDPENVPEDASEDDAQGGCEHRGRLGVNTEADQSKTTRQNSPPYSESVKGESTKGEATPFIPPSGGKNRRRHEALLHNFNDSYAVMCEVCGILFANLTKSEHNAVCNALVEIATVFNGTDQQLADAIESKAEKLKSMDWVNNITPGLISRYWNTPLE